MKADSSMNLVTARNAKLNRVENWKIWFHKFFLLHKILIWLMKVEFLFKSSSFTCTRLTTSPITVEFLAQNDHKSNKCYELQGSTRVGICWTSWWWFLIKGTSLYNIRYHVLVQIFYFRKISCFTLRLP